MFDENVLAETDVQGEGDVVFENVTFPTGIGHIEVPMRDEEGAYGAYQVIVEEMIDQS